MRIDTFSSRTNAIKFNNKINKTSFKSSFRSVYNDNFSLKYNTNTCFFRNDLNWIDFVDYIGEKYKKAKRVNIVNYACSTGEEAASLAMLLDIKFGENAQKFFPIKAYDIDEENIKEAKRGMFNINKGELDLLTKNTCDKYKDYFNEFINKDGDLVCLSSKADLDSKIIYKQSDIKKDIFKIPSGNTVLLCRNFIPYMTIGEEKTLVKQIADYLKSSSLVVLGKFEIDYGIEKLFEKEGFRHTKQYNVMEKLPFYKAFLTKMKYKLMLK